MTKNLKYILIVFSVIFCLAGLVGFQTSVNSRAYADGEPYIEFATYVDGETADTRVLDTQSQIANTPVVITYKITHNDGINSILLVPSYDDEVFEIASVTANNVTSYDIVVDETTVLGEATITEYDTTPVKILLESTGTEQVSKFSAVSGENEVFLTITYNIINAVDGNYGFGLVLKTDLETPVENGASEAYFIEDGQQKGEQTEVDIRFNSATLTIVTMKDAQIIIGSNDTVEEAAAYTFVYNGSAVSTTKVVDAFSETPTGVEYRYTDTTYNDLNFGVNIAPTITWYAYDSYYENNLGSQLADAPSAPGVYMVGISAPTNGIYRSVAETYRLVQITKRTISITIDNKSSAYGAPIVALTSDASADLVTSLSLVLSTTATSSSSVGDYPITATYTSSPYYNVNITDGTYTITKKAITITALDQNATYTGSEPTVDQSRYTVTGVDSISGVVITKAQGVNVGEYTLTPSLNNNNYQVTPVTGTFTITSVGNNADFVKSFFSGATVVYNAQNQNLLVVSNEKPDWIGFSAESSKKDVNTYQITVNILVSAQDAKNYMDASLVGDQNFVTTVNGEITPAALQITADNKGHVYGNAPATLTPAQVNGLGNDVINVTFTVKNGNDVITLANNTPVGAYTIVPSAANSNYNITFVNGTYTITKGTASITATANNINYNRPYDYTVSSVIVNTLSLDGNAYTVVIKNSNNETVDANSVPNAGSYKVVITVPGTDNYEGTTLEVPFTINKISLKTPTVEYNKDTATWTVVTTDSGDEALYNATVSYAINNNAVEGNSYKAISTDALTLTVSSSNDNYLPVNVTLENVYSVTFGEGTHEASDATAQNMPGAQYVFKGQKATEPSEVPTLDGYTFNAWDFAFTTTAINANTTVVALWNINTLTMTVIYVEETNKTEKTLTFTVDYKAEVAISDYNLKLKTGVTGNNDDFAMEYDLEGLHYEHIGLWNYKVTGSEEWIATEVHQIPVYPTSDLTFVAVYTSTPIEYVLTYKLSVDGGAYSVYGDTVDVAFGTTMEYNALTAAKWFKADAWFVDENRTTVAPATMPAGDLIVYGAIVFDIGQGDVNGDGSVNADDITLYRQWIVGGYTMNVVTVGGEYTTVTANNFDANARYFISKVADNNNDTSRDIRDVSITRMAIVGGYTWDKENGYNVTGNEIIRNVNTDALNSINGAITAGKKVTLTGNVTVADGEVNINTTKNVNINLGGNTLTVSKFNVVSNNRVTITVTNGTIVATNGITISAPNGNVVLTNLVGQDENGNIILQAASNSLHLNGVVAFQKVQNDEVVPAEVKVAVGTHIVVEENADFQVEKLVVVEVANVGSNEQAVTIAPATEKIIINNKSIDTSVIAVEGTFDDESEVQEVKVVGNDDVNIELYRAFANGGEFTFADDYVIDKQLVSNKDLTINLNGHTLSNTADIWNGDSWSLISVQGGTLTINGNGSLLAKENDCYAIDIREATAKLVINGGNFVGNVSAVYAYEGAVEINGGHFSILQLASNVPTDKYRYTLNLYDSSRINGTASIVVKGGSFENFNPANNLAEGPNTNFVAAGYIVTSENNVYTVIKDSNAIHSLADLEAFRDAVNAGDNFAGKTIVLYADITLNGAWTPISNYSRKDSANEAKWFAGTFDGNGHTISGLTDNGLTVGNITAIEEHTYGLFGSVKNAVIRNLTLTNVSINSNDGDSLGALAGYYLGNEVKTNIANVTVSGSIAGADNVGGLVGRASGSYFKATNITVSGTVTSTHKASGIVGTGNANEVVFENCTNNANVSSTVVNSNQGHNSVAGISITWYNACQKVVMAGCVNNGTITTINSNSIAGALAVDYSPMTNMNANGTWTFVNGSWKYAINDLAGLETFRNEVNAGNNFAGKTIVLNADITLNGAWTPISNYSRKDSANEAKWFAGTFDGNNHTISGLTNANLVGGNITDIEEFTYGLFGSVKNAVIKNLALTNVSIDADNGDSLGALVGYYVGSEVKTNIANVTVSGAIAGADNVGGLVGRASGSYFKATNITVSGTVTADYKASGIVGTGNANEIVFENCTNNANVSSTVVSEVNQGYNAVAGISITWQGYDNAQCCRKLVMTGCANNGTITTANTNAIAGALAVDYSPKVDINTNGTWTFVNGTWTLANNA